MGAAADDEDDLLRSVALRNATSILQARQRAERELLEAKETLRDTAERLRAVFQQASVGIAIADLDGRLLEANDRFIRILGYSDDELRALTIEAVTHPDNRDMTRDYLREMIEGTRTEITVEKRYLTKDGRAVWSRSSVTLIKDSAGRAHRIVGVVVDVTERKLAEEALREETRVLEVLNRTGAMLSSQLDLQSLLQAVTDAGTQISGARFGAFFYNVHEGGESYQLFALCGAPREAFERLGMPRATPLFGPTFRGEGVIRADDIRADPRYGLWGPHHGMPQGHLPVRSYLAVPVVSRDGEVLGGLFFAHEKPGVFTERSERLVRGLAAQAAIAIDNARLYEAAQKSAEERKQLLDSERFARAEAERASAMKDEFLATLSHELRTPLSAILGWAQVLRLRRMGEAELRQGLETIERNARIQTQLIEDLLDMSRITSGKLRLEVQRVDPSGFVEAAVDTVRPAAEAKGITLHLRHDPDTGTLAGDAGRLQQVVWNLLSNAIKFTPPGGRVQVTLQRVGTNVEIGVSDTGIGIRPEFLPYVFERFRQADASTTRAFGGLGLGLSIVRHLVELHGGSIRVESAGEGLGATFTVSLPCGDAASPAAGVRLGGAAARSVPLHAEHSQPDLSGVKVLVLDDADDARELIRRVLLECSAEVLPAANAQQALTLIERERPDVLISDIGMPDMDGYEFLRHVRALGDQRGGRVPAIALTAFARSEDRTRALHAGFLVHVAKPVEPSELVATVATVAGRTGL